VRKELVDAKALEDTIKEKLSQRLVV